VSFNVGPKYLRKRNLEMTDQPNSPPRVHLLLDKKLESLFAAIDVLLASDYWEPVLILIYAGIDAMAWLDRPADVARGNFNSWVDSYMMPDRINGISSTDLYSARCGLLHSHTGESDLHASDRARKICYVRQRDGDVMRRCLVQLYRQEKEPPWFVDVDVLAGNFRLATNRFQDAVAKDPGKLDLIRGRVEGYYFTEGILSG